MTSESAAVHWRSFSSREALLQQLATDLVDYANRTLAAQAAFDIVLAGGETPRSLYARLPHARTDWARWQVWFGDERCVPAGDPRRNDSMARAAWLDHVAIPAAQIHALDDAARYTQALAAVPCFDLVLLGLGEDGHTASLFPGHPWGDSSNAPAVLRVTDAPKPPRERLTLSAARLSASRAAWVLAWGENKRHALQRWQAGELLPVTAIRPAAGTVVYWCAD